MQPIDATVTGESRGYNIAAEWKMDGKGRRGNAPIGPIVFPPFSTPFQNHFLPTRLISV